MSEFVQAPVEQPDPTVIAHTYDLQAGDKVRLDCFSPSSGRPHVVKFVVETAIYDAELPFDPIITAQITANTRQKAESRLYPGRHYWICGVTTLRFGSMPIFEGVQADLVPGGTMWFQDPINDVEPDEVKGRVRGTSPITEMRVERNSFPPAGLFRRRTQRVF